MPNLSQLSKIYSITRAHHKTKYLFIRKNVPRVLYLQNNATQQNIILNQARYLHLNGSRILCQKKAENDDKKALTDTSKEQSKYSGIRKGESMIKNLEKIKEDKDLWMTDNMNTKQGRRNAATKDVFAGIIAIGAAGCCFYICWEVFNMIAPSFSKTPEQCVYSIAEKLVKTNQELKDSLGLDFIISKHKNKIQERNKYYVGDIITSGVTHDQNTGYDQIEIQFFLDSKDSRSLNRNVVVSCLFIKKPEQKQEKFFPMLIFAIFDFEKKYSYSKKQVIVVDYRDEVLKQNLDLDLLRSIFEEKCEREEERISRSLEEAKSEVTSFNKFKTNEIDDKK